jgi:tetratricopeptide (TPR) repeat protein
VTQQRLLSHASRCVQHLSDVNVVDVDKNQDSYDAFHNLDLLYADQSKMMKAKKTYQRALNEKKKAWGPEHTSTLNIVNNLGSLYEDQGKLIEAEKVYKRALNEYEKAWGLEHTSTLVLLYLLRLGC